MTREEAQKELSDLEPKEAEAWKAAFDETNAWNKCYADLRAEMDKLISERPRVTDAAQKRWLPLQARKQKLKSFLELTK